MISIVIPYIRRENIKHLKELIKDCGVEYEVLAMEDKERIGCPKMVKKLVVMAKFDLICFLGDDCLPEKDFLKHAFKCMQDNNAYLVGLNDGTGRDLPTHWLADKRLLEHLENREFFYTGYIHCYCDKELHDKVKELDKYVYCKEAMVKHNHPALTKTPTDDKDYLRVYSPQVKWRDASLYYSRKYNKPMIALDVKCTKCRNDIEIAVPKELLLSLSK